MWPFRKPRPDDLDVSHLVQLIDADVINIDDDAAPRYYELSNLPRVVPLKLVCKSSIYPQGLYQNVCNGRSLQVSRRGLQALREACERAVHRKRERLVNANPTATQTADAITQALIDHRRRELAELEAQLRR